jgi:DNA repair protein RadA/Sms
VNQQTRPGVNETPLYRCAGCGHSESRWYSQCVKCLRFHTITAVEANRPTVPLAAVPLGPNLAERQVMSLSQITPTRTSQTYHPPVAPRPAPAPIPLRELVALPLSAARIAEATAPRVATGVTEFDRVLGGGLVDGSFVLIGGDPGVGKSTLLLQTLHSMCRTEADGALYASGEESAAKLALRAQRLGIENTRLCVAGSNDLDDILALAVRMSPTVLVVDSLQALETRECDSAPGTAAQVAAVSRRLAAFANETKTPVIAIGQVTKDGEIAGPKSAQHDVDVVLYLETARGEQRRLVAWKNRYGATTEVGLFEMREDGLCGVDDDDDAALRERAHGVPGSALFPMVIGERVSLVEVQALVGPDKGDDAKGSLAISGADPKRVAMILAILARHAEIDVSDRDVYVSVTTGARLGDPAADLAIALAVASSFRDLPIDPAMACYGEIGLAGEIRSVAHAQLRNDEARRAGYSVLASARSIMQAIEIAIGQAVSGCHH